MIIKKTTTKKYEVKIFPNAWNIEFGKFIEARKKHGLKTKPFEHCFCCGHAFTEHEIPVVAQVSGKGNLFVCTECAKEEDAHEHD